MKQHTMTITRRFRHFPYIVASFVLATTTLAACGNGPPTTNQSNGIQKIKHIIVIMQENRSFDSYFGTYPGADGIPMQNGVPTVCVNDSRTGQCVKPYHNAADVNAGGPHAAASAKTDIHGGAMDGFITAFRAAQKACKNP